MSGRSDCKHCGGTGWVQRRDVKWERDTPCDCNPADWDELFASNFDAWLGTVIEFHETQKLERTKRSNS